MNRRSSSRSWYEIKDHHDKKNELAWVEFQESLSHHKLAAIFQSSG
jgi:hypothetical protein